MEHKQQQYDSVASTPGTPKSSGQSSGSFMSAYNTDRAQRWFAGCSVNTFRLPLLVLLFTVYTIVIFFADIICPDGSCGIDYHDTIDPHNSETPWGSTKGAFNNISKWDNLAFDMPPSKTHRHWQLLGLNRMECDQGRRVFISLVLGASIGYERRAPDRPAAVRIMAMVAVGACMFTLAGTYAFLKGPEIWDASRISAAIPSGVGFLGGAVIWKGAGAEGLAEVKGITTAAAIWASAATGVLCGGEMYFQAAYCSVITALMLRYGPNMFGMSDGPLEGEQPDFYYQETESDSQSDYQDDLEDPASRSRAGSLGHETQEPATELTSLRLGNPSNQTAQKLSSLNENSKWPPSPDLQARYEPRYEPNCIHNDGDWSRVKARNGTALGRSKSSKGFSRKGYRPQSRSVDWRHTNGQRCFDSST